MAEISGVAQRYDGLPVDYVSIFNWQDGLCIAQVIPNELGDWSYQYRKDLNVGITYVSDGCEPLTHGAYDFVYENLLPTDGLVLHYPFNGDAIDLSSNKIDAIIDNAPTFEAGRNDRLSVNTSAGGFHTSSNVPLMTKQLTISVWLKINTDDPYQAAIETISESIGVWYNDLAPSYIEVATKASTNQNKHARTAQINKLQEWKHFVFTIDRSLDTNDAAHVYINDVDVTGTTGTSGYTTLTNEVFNDDVFSFGLRYQNPSFRFKGLMQDVRIYNRVLTSAERTSLFYE